MKKALIILAAVGLTLQSGCGKKTEQNPGTKGKVTITFWHSFVSSTVPALDTLIATFERENPKIVINAQYVPTGDALVQKLITSVQSNTAPDISWIHSDFLQYLVEANAIYPMKTFIDGHDSLTAEDMTDIYPPLLQAASWRGTLYSMPMEATDLAIIYNKDMFRKVGLNPERGPQTWQELVDYAKKLTVKVGDSRQIGFFVPVYPAAGPLGAWMEWQWMPFLWQGGGDVINPSQTQILVDNPGGVQSLALWKQIYNFQDQSRFTVDYDAAFVSQQVAMILDGPWDLPRYQKILTNFNWGVVPLPAGPAGRATIMGGEYLAIFRQTKYPQQAWTFVKWLLRPEVQALWSMKSGYLPVRRAVMNLKGYQEFLKAHPRFAVYVNELKYGRSPRSIDYSGLEITRNIAEAIEKATLGNSDPKKALDVAAENSNKLLQAGGGN